MTFHHGKWTVPGLAGSHYFPTSNCLWYIPAILLTCLINDDHGLPQEILNGRRGLGALVHPLLQGKVPRGKDVVIFSITG